MHPLIGLHSSFDFDKSACHRLCAVCELKKPSKCVFVAVFSFFTLTFLFQNRCYNQRTQEFKGLWIKSRLDQDYPILK